MLWTVAGCQRDERRGGCSSRERDTPDADALTWHIDGWIDHNGFSERAKTVLIRLLNWVIVSVRVRARRLIDERVEGQELPRLRVVVAVDLIPRGPVRLA